jgi:hypothetical protein
VIKVDIVAKIFGYILGDGWIDKRGQCGISGEEDSLRNIAYDIDYVFGCGSSGEIKTRETYSSKYGIKGTTSQFVVKSYVSHGLQDFGMPTGRRPKQKFHIPKWIVNGSFETKASFMSGFYAAEGLIPSLQANKKTPRPLSFCFSKDKDLIDCSRFVAQQFYSILHDLGLKASIAETYEKTDCDKVKQTIVIGNSEQDFLHALKILDLNYCLSKENRRLQLITYFEMKSSLREKIKTLRDAIILERKETSITYLGLSKKFGLSFRQIEKIIKGRNKGTQVRGFPKFDQKFIDSYCSTETPLNDETLSDILRQTTTCQASQRSSA